MIYFHTRYPNCKPFFSTTISANFIIQKLTVNCRNDFSHTKNETIIKYGDNQLALSKITK